MRTRPLLTPAGPVAQAGRWRLLTAAAVVAVGGVVLVAGVGVFAKLADDVTDQDGATRADRVVSGFVTRHRVSWLTGVVEHVTSLADPPVLLAAAVVIGLALAWRRRALDPVLLLVGAMGGCLALGAEAKLVIHRPRPPVTWWAVHETGFSFPSMHTLAATATFGMLAYLAPRTWSRWARAGAWLGAFDGALLIAMTRVYLGVHWPTDVAASFALGAAWLAVLVIVSTVYDVLGRPDSG